MSSENSRSFWTFIIIVWGAAVFAADYFDALAEIRPLLTIGFLLVCPGMAFVRLLGLNSKWIEWTLAVAASLSIVALVATLLNLGGRSSEGLGLIIIWVISLAGSLLPVDLRLASSEEF